MKIKICGLFREEDIDYVNEALPDYIGFVFAQSRRQVSAELAARLRRRLKDGIVPVGVFVNATLGDIAALYSDGVIEIAQLHGDESEEYITRLKESTGSAPIPVIKVIKSSSLSNLSQRHVEPSVRDTAEHAEFSRCAYNSVPLCPRERQFEKGDADYYLFDSGTGSGRTFNWDILNPHCSLFTVHCSLFEKPWFLAGGICMDNIEEAMALGPFGIDVSGGAETDGVKDQEKILRLTVAARKGNMV